MRVSIVEENFSKKPEAAHTNTEYLSQLVKHSMIL